MEKLTVCVTGVGGGGLGAQIVKALRQAETSYHIIGADMTPLSTGFPMVDIPHRLPPARDKNYMDALLELCRRHHVKALFYGSEAELRVMSEYREAIGAEGIFLPINPPEVIDICMDKVRLSETLRQLGLQVPWFRSIRNLGEVGSIPDYPMVFKPSVGSGGSANAFVVQNDREANLFAEYLLGIYSEFIAQEYIGTPNDEYTIGILTDMEGSFINSIAVHRDLSFSLSSRTRLPNRTDRVELGPQLVISSGISQGKIGPFPEVTRPCEEIARLLNSRGALNIQCRFVGGRVYVFEINPRFFRYNLHARVGGLQ